MRTSSLTALFLTGVILAAAGDAAAAGLGKLTVLSSLGERLIADVELVSVTPAEMDSLKARVAPPQAYAHSNVPYSMALSDLHVKVEKHANGRPYLRITSAHPYNEPYLDVLLQLNWDGGELTREYTALVNPAGYHMPPAVAAGAPRSSAPAATAAAPAPQPRSAPRLRPAPAVAPTSTHAPDTYQVKYGDTLYGIAEATMPTEVTVDQMLIGLYRANPDAFHGNINRMKAGKILRIPSTQEIEQVSASKARREVKLQIANWHAYRNRLAAAASRKPAAAPKAGGAVSGKISTKVEEAHPKGATAPRDVVRLSKGEAPGSTAGKGENATARLQALEEEASARQKELDEANARIAQLEKTITDMRKLIEIKSAGMANAQQQAQQAASSTPPAGAAATTAAATQPAASTGSKPSASAPESTAASASTGTATAAAGTTAEAAAATKPEASAASSGSTVASASTAKSNSAATSESAAPAASGASPAAATAASATAAKPAATTVATAKESGTTASGTAHAAQSAEQAAAGKAEAKPAGQPRATAAHAAPKHHIIPKPAPQPGFLQMLTENPLYIGAAVIIILLLVYFWIRRRGTAGDGGSELQAAPVLAGGAAAATTAAAFAAVKESPPAASSQQPAASPQPAPAAPQPAAQTGAISDDVDPLAEAEVYIAYGRDEQAEEILKDALVHHPERTDVQIKLLEVYAARKDKAAFETLAQKLHQSVGSGSEEWLKVAALGCALDPANPLFEAGKTAPSPASPASTPEGLDFELDMPTAQAAADIQLDPASEDDSVSKTGRLSAQFAAAGLELTAPHGAVAPDFVLPGSTRGPEDTQRIADGEESAADGPVPIPDFTLDSGANAPAGLDFGDSDKHETAHADNGSGKLLNLEDSQLLMDEALKAARAEPLMPDFQLDLPAQSGSGTANAESPDGDHAGAPDLALDTAKSGDQPMMDFTLEPDAGEAAARNGTVPTVDLSGIKLDFDDHQSPAAAPAPEAKDGHWHDVQTKFDLAQAYQEMGDRDGAKEILREVVEEGDAEQKERAKALLRNLG